MRQGREDFSQTAFPFPQITVAPSKPLHEAFYILQSSEEVKTSDLKTSQHQEGDLHLLR